MAQLTLRRLPPLSLVNRDPTKVDKKHVSLMRLVLNPVESNQVISVPLAEQLVVGRTSGHFQPEIDLLQFAGGKCGISRRHAVFVYGDGALYLEDLKSTNGTRINGFKINAGELYRLHNGDEVEFGQLRLIVRVVRTPC